MSSEVLEKLLKIVEDVTHNPKFASDIPGAVQEILKRARKDSGLFACYIDELVTNAVRDLVYDVRHRDNVSFKRQAGYYGAAAKTNPGDSEEVQKVYQSVYSYRINGTILGLIRGEQLDTLIDNERGKADGHLFNASLLQWLKSQGVSGEKTVQEVVTEEKLKRSFDRLYKKAFERKTA